MTDILSTRAIYRGLILVVITVTAVWLLGLMSGTVLQIVFATILAAGMSPVVAAVTSSERAQQWRWRPPESLVILAIYLLVAILAFTVGALILGSLLDDLQLLAERLPEYGRQIRVWLSGLSAQAERVPALQAQLGSNPGERASGALMSSLGNVLQASVNVLGFALGTFGALLDAIFVLMLAMYVSTEGRKVRDFLIVFLPTDRQEGSNRLLNQMGMRLGNWVQGQIALCIIIGTLTWAGLSLLGVPYATLLGLVAAIGELIPTLGPIIAAVPAILVATLVSPSLGVGAAVLAGVIQMLENNVIVPKVMSKAVNLNPLVVIVAILAGSEVYGVTGAILAIPVSAVLAVAVEAARGERVASIAATRLASFHLDGPIDASAAREDERASEPAI